MIDIRDYDLAVLNRIKTFYKNTHWVMRPNLPLQEIRDRKVLNGEDIDFPLIVVRRTNCPIFSVDYNSWSRAKTGQSYLTGENKSGIRHLQDYDIELANKITDGGYKDGLSVVNSTFNLTYYLDVIALERDNFDTLLVELQENLFRIPFIEFDNIKTDGIQDHLINGQACHFLVEEVEDTSDLENFDTGNALYRATITVKINAYIYRKYRSTTVDVLKIALHDYPEWLYSKGLYDIREYFLSNYMKEKLKSRGYKDLDDFVSCRGYKTFDDFFKAFIVGKEPDVTLNYNLGTDGLWVVFEVPSKE